MQVYEIIAENESLVGHGDGGNIILSAKDGVNHNVAKDPGLWLDLSTDDVAYWIACGPSDCQHHNGPFDSQIKGTMILKKVETLSTEPEEAEQGKEVSSESKTYTPKDEVKPGSEAADSDKRLSSALTLPPSSPGTLESPITWGDETEINLKPPEGEYVDTQAAQVSPEQMASFPSAAMPTAEHVLSETTEKLLGMEEKDSLLTKITDYCENSDHEQGSCASRVNSVNHQQTLSNIRCVPVLVRDTNKRLNQPWKTSDNLRGWAPEDCQDPPCSMKQDGKGDNVSENNKVLIFCQVPSGSLSHTQFSYDLKNDNGGLIECHTSSPKSNCSSGSKHSSMNCASQKLHMENSKSSGKKRCSSRSPCMQEHSSRAPQKQKHGSQSPHRQECGSGSPHRKEYHTRSPKRQKHGSGSHKQQHTSVSPQKQKYGSRSPYRQEHASGSPHRKEYTSGFSHMPKLSPQNKNLSSPQRRREDSHKRVHYSYPHCKYNCSCSQKITWDILPCFSGKIKGHHSPQARRKIYKVSHHQHPESTTMKRKKKNETELEKPTKKKKTTLEKRMKSIKLEKQTTQGHVSSSHDETSTLPEAAQDLLLPVLPPVRTEESEQIGAKSENTPSPHQPSAGEKNSSSTMPWTPKDRSAAVLARKEAIEEAYLQVLLNFAGVATMLVEKAPCMQEAMDSALRANLRRIGDYYGCMLTNYIDSLAEAS
ncbi:hypothetical protein JRQ81_015171 [Phrynocephalus forsythii]|uniref:Periphilin-1 C-terminal domain-containing protein n=1 Tax=Phrynocephalus forsythii TaxID=171643 RepID=A0A9Q0XYR6_9SAUR|nr:hypothetical protein JRQ81_015171 [Phrynocephalus forsythii]